MMMMIVIAMVVMMGLPVVTEMMSMAAGTTGGEYSVNERNVANVEGARIHPVEKDSVVDLDNDASPAVWMSLALESKAPPFGRFCLCQATLQVHSEDVLFSAHQRKMLPICGRPCLGGRVWLAEGYD